MDEQPTDDAYDSENPSGGFTEGNTEAGVPSAKKNPRDNLRPPWKPGESGNRSGRPKRGPISDAFARMLDQQVPKAMLEASKLKGNKALPKKPTFADLMAFSMFNQVLKGNVAAVKEILNRTEGKTPQHVNLSSTDKLDELIAAMDAGGLDYVPDPPEDAEDDPHPDGCRCDPCTDIRERIGG